MTGGPPRRVVTGHDASGRGVVLSDGPPPHVRDVPDGAMFVEVWSTASTPAPITAAQPEPAPPGSELRPPAGGTRVRMVVMPPGTRSPMHRTESIDYGIVLQGSVVLVLDGTERALAAGDVVIQRGTDHAWENRGDADARVVFVLVDGAFAQPLLDTLPADAS
ncbi:MAG TPA: cupin domain-containing protein [Solirubrobacteraceae bacterium]|jgi:quercetin dioxygenase-like cupin family protein|nr:cupin domain-containing protein [Solirubrobacteraceae bacterium]